MDEKAFGSWLDDAQPGDRTVYAVATHLPGRKVGKAAYKAYRAGKVRLMQRRAAHEGAACFQYIAERISPTQKKRDDRLSEWLMARYPAPKLWGARA